MSNKAVFTGVVLAGGQSSRMGSDKANLILKNKTLLQNACELLKAAGASNVLISRNVQSATSQYIPDIYPDSGPLGGIYSTLMATEQDILVTAVDMPLLTCNLLSQIVSVVSDKSHFQKNQPQIHTWHFENEPLPLYIRNTQSVKRHLKQLLISANSHKSIKQFTRSIGVQTLKCDKAHALVNTNTPAQFKAVNEQFDQHKPNLLRRTL
ncbi:molybdenum cofactor guanylyltransferase [Pseudoalteromonas aliena]|uniref:molybdenum cofactor guanylyltransferase n=1 Tax=Pseudoalteromonas aliena TaxID=247523 RepID=UPI00311F8FE6